MKNRPHRQGGRHKPKPIKEHEHRHYWPYLPVILLLIATFAVNLTHFGSRKGVLAYATEISRSTLLSATNSQRQKHDAGTLTLSSKLNSAAQAKANDMVSRNYWAHNTPDGEEPWVFMDNAGYKYQKAGENLAYGFASSGQTVSGWMNSATHKANLLDDAFTEVGFGFANGTDFNNSGEETVVVAMYGRPQVLAKTETTSSPSATDSPVATSKKPAEKSSKSKQKTDKQKRKAESTAVVTPKDSEPPTQAIARVGTLTNGRMQWLTFAIGLASGLAVMFLLVRHTARLRHLIRDGERFILHHPLLDTILVGIIFVGSLLSQTTGFIR